MVGIKFGEYHTWKDWELYLQKISIDLPLRKEHLVAVPGMDGAIDLSEALTEGEPRYQNRILAFSFEFEDGGYGGMLTKESIISNAINGKRLKIILDEDPRYYYMGVPQVKVDKINSMVSGLDITVSADPYKYDVLSSTDNWLWDSFNFQTGIIYNLAGLRIDNNTVTIPGIAEASTIAIFNVAQASSQMTVTYKGRTYNLCAGRNRFPQIRVGNGPASLVFTGKGIVDIEFRRRSQ